MLDSGGALGNNFNFEFFTNGNVSDSADWSDFTPRLALVFDVNDDVNALRNRVDGLQVRRLRHLRLRPERPGHQRRRLRPGGHDAARVRSRAGGQLRDRRQDAAPRQHAAANVSLFLYDYTDLQLVYFDQGSSQVANVGEARGQGLELDLRWVPNAHWDATVGLSFLDTEITDATDIIEVGACGDCDGNSLPFAPEVSASTILTYRTPIASGRGLLHDRIRLPIEDVRRPRQHPGRHGRRPGTKFNFRLGYRSASTWYVTLWVENAFDEVYFERGWENADADNLFGYGLFNELVWPSRPRTVGITFGMEWE